MLFILNSFIIYNNEGSKTEPSFYLFFCNITIVSTWELCGNISTGCTHLTIYERSTKIFKSLAKVAGLQEIYTILGIFISHIV